MKKLYFILMFLSSQLFLAQVGINTTNPNAQLDVRSSNQASPALTDGIMIPKVDNLLFPTATQHGIMVFLTTSYNFMGSTKQPGFYYWDNNALDWLGLGNATGWSTTGNTGTSPSDNFIGTKDNADLIFRINNQHAGRLNIGNTSFGWNSIVNPSSFDNSAFGISALQSVRSGSDNVAFGKMAMQFNQDGRRNIAIGNESLKMMSNRSDNLAIGHFALNGATTSEFNLAIGNFALQSNNTGASNIAIGYQSQFNNAFASDNVTVGRNTLLNNVFGNGNTAVGNYTLNSGGHIENSTAVGFRALSNSNTYDNTAVGYEAMVSNSSGRFNTGIGKHALAANSSGDSNTSLGNNSLNTNTTGSKNTAIGADATTMMANLTNATAIGANAMVADSNSMVLGSVSGFNNAFNNTNVGIGTVVPSERLHIVGRFRMEDGNQGAGKLLVSDTNGIASWQNASSFAWSTNGNTFTDPNVNYIGTADHTDLVFRRNNIRSGFIAEDNTHFGFNSFMNGQNNSIFGAHPFSSGLSGSNNAIFGYEALSSCTSCGDNATFGYNSMKSNIAGGANVAVGSSSLENMDFGNFNTAIGYASAPNITSGTGNVAIGSNSLKGNNTDNNTAIGSETSVNSGLQGNSTAIGARAQVDLANSMVLGSVAGVNGATNSVNVGIGTTFPLDRLHVVGNIRMVDGNQGAGKILTSDANGTATWQTPAAASSGTLDQAYDFGGAGSGRTIIADTGAVTIAGNDGLVSTGISGSGAIAPSGAGTRMVWNPRKAAFRAGQIGSGLTMWDDINIGERSTAFGGNTTASGNASIAFGAGTTASGLISTAFGNSTWASSTFSTAFGGYTVASGTTSTAFGSFTTANGISSTAFGVQNYAASHGETVLGLGATNYTTSVNGSTQFRATNSTDRLFVIGNAIDINGNDAVDLTERSDAIVILKNGLTRLPSTTNAMITAADGKAVVTKEYLQSNTSGTLDQAYDFGGAGLGKTITADAGAVTIGGIDGLVSTGASGSGALMPSGEGVRMVWNPRKAAFRAGRVSGAEWDDANVGENSIAMGFGTRASGHTSIALGSNSTALGMGSVAFGWGANANATQSTAFGLATHANNVYSTAFGYQTTTSGRASTSFGIGNEAESFGEVALGIGATTYTPSTNGVNQFRTANATDRLFVIGNAIDANNNDVIDTAERSDALIILKNGLTRLPSTTNAMITAADGKAVVTKEYLQTLNPGWNLTGNTGTNATTNFIGTTDNQGLSFRTNSIERMNILNTGNVGIATNTPSQRLEVATGNIEVTQGDIYLGTSNGVFNAGGGLMNALINYIGDAYVAPVQVNGDEDLYIEDDIELGGQGYKPGGGLWVAPSDRRLKQNIKPYTDGLESLLRINPVTYKYNNIFKTLDTGETYVGVIAQEVQEIAPYMITEKPFGQLVEEDENGKEKIVNQGTPYLTFDGSALTYMLINAVKEMNLKNQDLKSENENLKKEVELLNEKVNAIIATIEGLKK